MVQTTKGAVDPKSKAATKAAPKAGVKTKAPAKTAESLFTQNEIPDAVAIARADAEASSTESEPKPEFEAKTRDTSIRLDDSTWDRVLQAAGSSGRTADEVIKDIIENALGVGSPSTTHHGG